MNRTTLLCSLLLVAAVACNAPWEADPATEAPPPAPAAAPEPAATVVSEAPLLPNAVSPEEGLLFGGQPSAEQLDRIAAAGYRTVVNLRGSDEEGQLPDEAYGEHGLEIVHLPVTGAEDVDEENARRLGELIDDPEKRPLVVHCGSGNRVGALVALEAFHVEGASPQEALETGLGSGLTRLEPVVRERLGLPAPEAGEAPSAPGP